VVAAATAPVVVSVDTVGELDVIKSSRKHFIPDGAVVSSPLLHSLCFAAFVEFNVSPRPEWRVGNIVDMTVYKEGK
jgi:hypothetical protein